MWEILPGESYGECPLSRRFALFHPTLGPRTFAENFGPELLSYAAAAEVTCRAQASAWR
jgi:hypothetical protein